MDPQAILMLGVGTLVGTGIYLHGLSLYRMHKLIQYTPTSKAISAAPGICEVQGRAQNQGADKTAPYARKPCVFYQTAIYRWAGSGKHRSRGHVKTLYSHAPFAIQDDTGRITIQPPIPAGSRSPMAGQNYLKRDVDAHGVPSKATLGGMLRGAAALLTGRKAEPDPEPAPQSDKGRLRALLRAECPDLLEYGDQVDVEETYIEPGDPIYVLGTARADTKTADGIEVGRDPANGLFCISDGSEKEASGKTAWRAYAYSLIGPLVFGFCVFGIAALVEARWMSELAVLLTLLMYLSFGLTNLLELYNGTVRLRQNIERARANVDSLYTLRHELVPRLVSVVEASAKHEKRLQTELARARTMQMGAAGRTLIAAAEDYPALQANKSFSALQQQLEEIAEKLAGSQTYLVDATTLYNARVQSFPYFLFMPLVGLRTVPMPDFKTAD